MVVRDAVGILVRGRKRDERGEVCKDASRDCFNVPPCNIALDSLAL
jgi:hypothetical protein